MRDSLFYDFGQDQIRLRPEAGAESLADHWEWLANALTGWGGVVTILLKYISNKNFSGGVTNEIVEKADDLGCVGC
ncbi:MAG: hypothetical protein RSG50_01815, partial [Clostridia bacterium]